MERKKPEEAVKKILSEITEPESGKPLIESGMIKKIEVKDKKAVVELLPASAGCALCFVMQALIAEIEEKLRENGFEPEVGFVLEQ